MQIKKIEWLEMAGGNWWQDKLTKWFGISQHDPNVVEFRKVGK